MHTIARETTPAAYTPEGFCRAFGVGRTKLYAEIGSGRLKARKLGRRTLILAADAAAWASALPAVQVRQ